MFNGYNYMKEFFQIVQPRPYYDKTSMQFIVFKQQTSTRSHTLDGGSTVIPPSWYLYDKYATMEALLKRFPLTVDSFPTADVYQIFMDGQCPKLSVYLVVSDNPVEYTILPFYST